MYNLIWYHARIKAGTRVKPKTGSDSQEIDAQKEHPAIEKTGQYRIFP